MNCTNTLVNELQHLFATSEKLDYYSSTRFTLTEVDRNELNANLHCRMNNLNRLTSISGCCEITNFNDFRLNLIVYKLENAHHLLLDTGYHDLTPGETCAFNFNAIRNKILNLKL